MNTIDFRIGLQLFRVAEEYVSEREPDLAAVMLVAAVDASLRGGIAELWHWRRITLGATPPTESEVEEWLKSNDDRKKLHRFERLVGENLASATQRLHGNSQIPTGELPGFDQIVSDHQVLADQRNRFLHLGRAVDANVISMSLKPTYRAVWLLNRMYLDTFDLQKPMLPGAPI